MSEILAAGAFLAWALVVWVYMPWQIWQWCKCGRFRDIIDESYDENGALTEIGRYHAGMVRR